MGVVLGVDQSINGTGLCVLKDASPVLLKTVKQDASMGFARFDNICREIETIISTHQPNIVVAEECTGHNHSASLMGLVELLGCIKLTVYRLGYRADREAYLKGDKVFVCQNQSSMKKFCLGSGSVKKDSGYLLSVFQRMHVQFEDDNQADAYMHAWMVEIVRGVVCGDIDIDDLPTHQQETLIARGVKSRKGLSMTRAMKMSAEEKRNLVGY